MSHKQPPPPTFDFMALLSGSAPNLDPPRGDTLHDGDCRAIPPTREQIRARHQRAINDMRQRIQ